MSVRLCRAGSTSTAHLSVMDWHAELSMSQAETQAREEDQALRHDDVRLVDGSTGDVLDSWALLPGDSNT